MNWNSIHNLNSIENQQSNSIRRTTHLTTMSKSTTNTTEKLRQYGIGKDKQNIYKIKICTQFNVFVCDNRMQYGNVMLWQKWISGSVAVGWCSSLLLNKQNNHVPNRISSRHIPSSSHSDKQQLTLRAHAKTSNMECFRFFSIFLSRFPFAGFCQWFAGLFANKLYLISPRVCELRAELCICMCDGGLQRNGIIMQPATNALSSASI